MANMTSTFKVAVVMMLFILIFLGAITFLPDTFNDKFTNRIVTFMQTIFTVLLTFYWGTSTKNRGIETTVDPGSSSTETIEKTTTVNTTEKDNVNEVEKKP